MEDQYRCMFTCEDRRNIMFQNFGVLLSVTHRNCNRWRHHAKLCPLPRANLLWNCLTVSGNGSIELPDKLVVLMSSSLLQPFFPDVLRQTLVVIGQPEFSCMG